MTETEARDEICRIGRSLFDRGYVHATAGNISVRLHDGGFLITPTDACLGFLDPAQLSRDGGELHAAPGGGPGEQLPVAEVGHGDDDSPALRPRRLEALPAAETDEVLQITVRKPAHERDLRETPAQLCVGGAGEAAALALGKLGKGAAQTIESDLAAEAY